MTSNECQGGPAEGDNGTHGVSWDHRGSLGDHPVRQCSKQLALNFCTLLISANKVRHEYGPEVVLSIFWEVILETHGGLPQRIVSPDLIWVPIINSRPFVHSSNHCGLLRTNTTDVEAFHLEVCAWPLSPTAVATAVSDL